MGMFVRAVCTDDFGLVVCEASFPGGRCAFETERVERARVSDYPEVLAVMAVIDGLGGVAGAVNAVGLCIRGFALATIWCKECGGYVAACD